MKVCPRCSFVDTDGRRVCFACRRSLMGTSEMTLIEVLELREAALSGADGAMAKAPWGPGLTALVEQALEESDLALGVVPPEAPPAPVRAAAADGAMDELADVERLLAAPSFASGGGGRPVFGDLPPSPQVERIALDDLAAFDAPVDDRVDVSDGSAVLNGSAVDAAHDLSDLSDVADGGATGSGSEAHVAADGHDDEVEELAEITRQQLAKLYDARLAAPVLLEVDSATNAPRPSAGADPSARSARSARSAPSARSPRSPNRRRVVLALVLVVAALYGFRYVRAGLQGDEQALVQDPTTPVDELPWRFVDNGPVRINLPMTPITAPGSAYQRVNLPDLAASIGVHTPIPSLNSDLSLRTYTIQLASQMGGRFVNGSAYDVSLGTAFTALVEADGGTTVLYVLSTPEALVEVRGDFLAEDQGRASAILERMVRSIDVD